MAAAAVAAPGLYPVTLAALEAYFAAKSKPAEGQTVSGKPRLAPTVPAAKGSSRVRAPPCRGGSANSSPVPGTSGLPNLNLSSDEGEFTLGVESDSVGFDSESDDLDDQGRPISWDDCLSVSAPAYQGLWTVDRKTSRKFLPIFLVSGYRVDYFPDDQTVRVAWHRYDVERHLSLERSQVARQVLAEYAVQFSILGDMNFVEFIRGGEFVRLSQVAQTYKEMGPRAEVGAPRLPVLRPLLLLCRSLSLLWLRWLRPNRLLFAYSSPSLIRISRIGRSHGFLTLISALFCVTRKGTLRSLRRRTKRTP